MADQTLPNIEISDFDEEVASSKLEDYGIEIVNIAATLDFDGEFDRKKLGEDLRDAEYDAEKHRSVVFRSKGKRNLTALIPPRGRVSIAGAKDKQDIERCVGDLLDALKELGIERRHSPVRVENIVASANIGKSVDLATKAIELGLEKTEYEPEVFPGLIYKDEYTANLFGSGKMVILGMDTYAAILEAFLDFSKKLSVN